MVVCKNSLVEKQNMSLIKFNNIYFWFLPILFMTKAFSFDFFGIKISQIVFVFVFIFSLIDFLYWKRFFLSKRIFYIFSVLFFLLLISFAKNDDFKRLYSFVGVLIYTMTFYMIVYDKLELCYKSYIYTSFLLSLVAILQQISYLLNISVFYDFSWLGITVNNFTNNGIFLRVNSLFSEPSHLGSFLIPAMLILYLQFFSSLYRVCLISKFVAVVIFLAFVMTFSFVSYFSFFLGVMYLSLKLNKSLINKLLGVFITSAILLTTFLFIPSVNEKLVSLMLSFRDDDLLLSTSGLSSFAVISNLNVAMHAFLESPLFGVGMFNHELVYNKYISYLYGSDIEYFLNVSDASSMYIRFVSEFGLSGLVVAVILFYSVKPKVALCSDTESIYLLIHWVFFISIFLVVVRDGNYFSPILLFLYAFCVSSAERNNI